MCSIAQAVMKKHGSSPQSVTTPRTLSPSRRQKLEMIQKRENAKHRSARMEAILKKKMLASCGIQEVITWVSSTQSCRCVFNCRAIKSKLRSCSMCVCVCVCALVSHHPSASIINRVDEADRFEQSHSYI